VIRKIILATAFIISIITGFEGKPEMRVNLNAADTTDYFGKQLIRYENYCYKPTIRTIRFYRAGTDLFPPVIRLGSQDLLQLSFDDLDGDAKMYQYKIIHCSFDWKPSDLVESQYQTGYSNYQVTDSHSSVKTSQHFTHYKLQIPNDEIQPAISGNFLLVVYQDYNQENLVLTRQFMVVDPKVEVMASVHPATVVRDHNSKQEVDFSILKNGYNIENPFNDLKVAISQNDRTDNMITSLKPLFLNGDQLDYDFESGNVFNGGNEFRYFDIRSLIVTQEHVKKIISRDDTVHVYLADDNKRSYNRYSPEEDMNGAYEITTIKGYENDLEADYCMVHFRLSMDTPYRSGNLYVFGSLSDWFVSAATKMSYNEEDHSYQAAIYLKQGYYDYEYVYIEDGFNIANESEIEGNHSETENTYMIYVYNKPVNSRYDELIGVKRLRTYH
jgi:hypothetical protein